MTVADDLRQGAIDTFDALTGVPIDVIYRHRNPVDYVPGGTTNITDTDYSLRVIRETADQSDLVVAPDVKTEVVRLMFIPSELPVPANLNDIVIGATEEYTIDSFSNDPVDAVTTLVCEVR